MHKKVDLGLLIQEFSGLSALAETWDHVACSDQYTMSASTKLRPLSEWLLIFLFPFWGDQRTRWVRRHGSKEAWITLSPIKGSYPCESADLQVNFAWVRKRHWHWATGGCFFQQHTVVSCSCILNCLGGWNGGWKEGLLSSHCFPSFPLSSSSISFFSHLLLSFFPPSPTSLPFLLPQWLILSC